MEIFVLEWLCLACIKLTILCSVSLLLSTLSIALALSQCKSVEVMPSSLLPALKCLAKALLVYVVFFCSKYVPTLGYLDTDKFLEQGLAYRYDNDTLCAMRG